MGGGTLPKLFESVILTTGPNVSLATFELNTRGMNCPLLSYTNTATFGTPWLRLTPVGMMMCCESIGGFHAPEIRFDESGFRMLNVRVLTVNRDTCSCSKRPTLLPTMPMVMK